MSFLESFKVRKITVLIRKGKGGSVFYRWVGSIYTLIKKVIDLETGKSRQKYYEITKNGFSFLVMGYTGKKAGKFKEMLIREFDKLLSTVNGLSRLEILEIATKAEKERLALEGVIQQKDERLVLQQDIIKKAAPRVEYYEDVLQSKSLIGANIIAKDLDMSAITMNRILHEKGVIYKSGNTWVLYREYQGKGYTKTKTYTFENRKGEERTNVQLYWTEKGWKFIDDLLNAAQVA